jgi:hypothetical protein
MTGLKRFLAIGAVIAPLMTACSDVPTEPQPQPRFTRQFYTGVEQVEVVARDFETGEASAMRKIGRLGGSVSVGGVTLVIPPGALDRVVAITVTVPAGGQLSVKLEPHGIQFNRPAYLAFVLNGTDYNEANVDELSGAFHQDGMTASVVTPREIMPIEIMNGLAAFGVWHFSDYAVTKKRKGLILVGG